MLLQKMHLGGAEVWRAGEGKKGIWERQQKSVKEYQKELKMNQEVEQQYE